MKELTDFLIAANLAGFVSNDPKVLIKEADGSTTISFTAGDYTFNDNFFGGEPYGGRIIVHYQNKPYWLMVYYGWVNPGFVADAVYEILKGAMREMPEIAPYRGPENLSLKDGEYKNTWEGSPERYSGHEQIMISGKLAYEAYYRGGLVDQSKQ